MSKKTHNNAFEELREGLDNLIDRYRYPQERRIGYGNLRQEYSDWEKDGNTTTNVAIVYETPGGSTAQINITHDSGQGHFSYLQQEQERPVTTDCVESVLDVVKEQVTAIPRKRRSVLFRQIETWCAEGRPVFEELNKLLQSEFLGGRINHHELRDGINYAIDCRKRAGYVPPGGES